MCFRYYWNVTSYLLSSILKHNIWHCHVTFKIAMVDCFPSSRSFFSVAYLIVTLLKLLFRRSTCILHCSSSNYITFIIYWSFVSILLLYFLWLHLNVVSDVTGTRSCRIFHTPFFQLISSCSCAYSSFDDLLTSSTDPQLWFPLTLCLVRQLWDGSGSPSFSDSEYRFSVLSSWARFRTETIGQMKSKNVT